MSRKIDIESGDYGRQTAEYTLQGLYQTPALTLRAPVGKKRFLFGYKWREQVWPLTERVKKLEKIEDVAEQAAGEWNLPGVGDYKERGKWRRFFFYVVPPKRSFAATTRQAKKIRFRLLFKDGTHLTASADARVFQNILAVVGG